MTVTVNFSLYIMDLMIKINHEQYDKVTGLMFLSLLTITGAVDFRGKRTSKDRMPAEGVGFDKILALLPLKMLIFLQFIPAKQGFHSNTYGLFTKLPH